MNENVFNDFLIGMWKWVVYAIKAYLPYGLYFVHIVEAFVHVGYETNSWIHNWPYTTQLYMSKLLVCSI